MLQELFKLPFIHFPIYGYGLMLVVGFLCASQLARFLARRSAIDPEVFSTAVLIMLVTGVAGARISHILENFHEYTSASFIENVRHMLDVRNGGLTYYGGFLLATPCTILYGLYKKVPIRRGMDIVAPCLMVGLAFGRIGCFLNGCCYGAETTLPWGVSFPYYSNAYVDEFYHANGTKLQTPVPRDLLVNTPDGGETLLEPSRLNADPALKSEAASVGSNYVHPTELYSSFTAFMLALLLFAYYTLPHPPGRVFAMMLILEGGTRFLLELIRVEPPVPGFGPMSLSMILGVVLVASGLLMWVWTGGPDDDLAFQPVSSASPLMA
jgi:phosphatidylglycerol:prolipoprotein diacylglycerol transferase